MNKEEFRELYDYYDNTRNISNKSSRHDGENKSKQYIKYGIH